MVHVYDDAKGGLYRRLEVLTGPGRRRKWSSEANARIVAEALAPGALVNVRRTATEQKARIKILDGTFVPLAMQRAAPPGHWAVKPRL